MTELGVYVHVPFCRQRCDYCAFATYTDRDALMERYVDACVTDVRRAVEAGELGEATSVFFGGGTPSRLPAAWLGRILAAIPRAPGAEVTVECNPEDASDERLAAYAAAGVTRMSFGVQSTARHVLVSLGRRHDPESVPRAVDAAASCGFSHVNLDLIYGAAGETDEDWARTIDDVLSLPHPPGHLSAYALTVEPGTPLARDPARHPDDDVQATRYEAVDAKLSAAGYRWEEVSNWALPGHGCRHNRLYWRQGDYVGIGSAAHSHRARAGSARRWWNVRTPDRYVAAVEAGRSPVAGEERVEGEGRELERLMLSLRTPAGVPERALPGCDELDGLVVRAGGRVVLTVRGRLMANAVSSMLVAGTGPVTVGAPSGAEVPGRYPALP
ncbi:MAG TPA: radical SAM family heme chaperone HemW [Acidimicrobiales bacterium]|nr:radical SAM family heme chaperone HemW [Acidimicrobiales bacterium]